MTGRSQRLLNVALIAILACHAQAGAPPNVDDPAREISIRVVNRNRLDVMVYMEHDGMRTRLGLAIASTTTDFNLRLGVLGAGRDYRLVAHPIGMRIYVTTEMLHALAGDEVTWSIEDSFARSTVIVH